MIKDLLRELENHPTELRVRRDLVDKLADEIAHLYLENPFFIRGQILLGRATLRGTPIKVVDA